MAPVPESGDVLARIERIQRLIDELTKAQGDFSTQQDIADRLRREFDEVKARIKPMRTHDAPQGQQQVALQNLGDLSADLDAAKRAGEQAVKTITKAKRKTKRVKAMLAKSVRKRKRTRKKR